MLNKFQYLFITRGSVHEPTRLYLGRPSRFWPLFITGLLTFCANGLVRAQDTLTAEVFFRRILAQSQPEAAPTDREVKFPLIEQYEFRTETDEFDFNRQEYAIRLSPGSRRKQRAQTELYNHLAGQPDFERAEIDCAAKMAANIDWLYLFYYHRKLALLDDLDMIYRDRQVILQQNLASLRYQNRSIIEEETDRNDLALELFDTQNELVFLYRKYDLNDPTVSFVNFLAVEQLPDALNLPNPDNNLRSRENAYELAQLEKELDLESAERREVFDFVQFNYRGPHADAFRERFSIGAAFNLNRSGNRKLNVEELQLEKQRLTTEMQRDQSLLADELAGIELEFQKDLAYYNYFQETTDKERTYLNTLADQLLTRADFNPLQVLEIRERQLENELEALRLARNLYEQYLEFIYKSERVCAESRLNFLAIAGR